MRLSSLIKLCSRPRSQSDAQRLYAAILAHSRQSWPYVDYEVPDNLDGRFDMVLLIAAPVLRSLKHAGFEVLAQDLVTQMFDDFDIALRQMGVSDLGMKRRMRALAEAYAGRMQVYGSLLDNSEFDDTQYQAELEEALRRNLYRQQDSCPQSVVAMAKAWHQFAKALEKEHSFVHSAALPPFAPE